MLAPLTDKDRSTHWLEQFNEKNVRDVLEAVTQGLKLELIDSIECGLLCRKDKIHLETSLDGWNTSVRMHSCVAN